MKEFWKKLAFLSVFVLTLPLFLTGTQAAAARHAPMHELTYFEAHAAKVDGQDAWHIEIGLDNDAVAYEVRQKTLLKQEIVLDLADTRRGGLAQTIRQQSDIVSGIRIDETQDRRTEIHIALHPAYGDASYRVTALDADRHARKPYRLAIDIFKKPAAPPVESVEGVRGHHITLDAGHGGSDTGAVGPSRVTEASVTLAVTQDLEDILKASGADVSMTRDMDVDVYGPDATAGQELQARVDVGNRAGAEVFLSIHCNAFSNPGANGMETYYYAGSRQGERLATLLNEELEKAGGRKNRGVKTAGFYVLRHSDMPASLVELAFVTNPAEEALLADEGYQHKLARALAVGLSRYFLER